VVNSQRLSFAPYPALAHSSTVPRRRPSSTAFAGSDRWIDSSHGELAGVRNDETLAQLAPVGNLIVDSELARTKVTDRGIPILAKNLTHRKNTKPIVSQVCRIAWGDRSDIPKRRRGPGTVGALTR
jgi:hypothetical protein